MLNPTDKSKLNQYIDRLFHDLEKTAQAQLEETKDSESIIKNIVAETVNKVTPASKMLITSIYTALKKETTKKEFYADPIHLAAFNELGIQRKLQQKFSFDIPQQINYQEVKLKMADWGKSGAVVVVGGGIVTIPMGITTPVGIAVVIAGILYGFIQYQRNKNDNKHELKRRIHEYLKAVRASLEQWLKDIEKEYDTQVAALEQRLVK